MSPGRDQARRSYSSHCSASAPAARAAPYAATDFHRPRFMAGDYRRFRGGDQWHDPGELVFATFRSGTRSNVARLPGLWLARLRQGLPFLPRLLLDVLAGHGRRTVLFIGHGTTSVG